MHKFKFFIDFEKEERWLEELAEQGWHLKGTFLGYQFKKGEPNSKPIKIDFRKFKRKADFIDYCTLFEDSGWKHLAGSRNSGVQYFMKMDETGAGDIFSDADSKAARYKRYAAASFELAMSFLPLLIVFCLTDLVDFDAFLNPKELYLTPGIWEKRGSAFWSSFLIETPFAVMRGFIWSFIPVMVILYFVFSWRSNKLYLQKKGARNM